MIAKTTEDFVENEVVPLIDKPENHEFEYTVKLLKQARIRLVGYGCTGRIRRFRSG